MNRLKSIQLLVAALRIGASVANPTPWRWYGLAVSIGASALAAGSTWLAARGWLDQSLSVGEAAEVAGMLLAALASGASAVVQAASGVDVGLLPKSRTDDSGAFDDHGV